MTTTTITSECGAKIDVDYYPDEILGADEYRASIDLEIDGDVATLRATERHGSEGTLRPHWTGEVLYTCAPMSQGAAVVVDADAIENLAEEIAPFAERVILSRVDDGWTDGDDAVEAWAAICVMIDTHDCWSHTVKCWDAGDWLFEATTLPEILDMLRIEQSATVDEIEAAIHQRVSDESSLRLYDVFGAAKALREQLDEMLEDEAAN